MLTRRQVERCRNPFWLGTPHFTTEDFTYKGQLIPKDTVVLLNTWTMHHNPERYPDPNAFNVRMTLSSNLSPFSGETHAC